ncbi:MAG TPA: hypothetical protein VEC36_06355 [Patescibacteria group bacterium]|nr:hypothetical protein [Patescibacteria group bacterium]
MKRFLIIALLAAAIGAFYYFRNPMPTPDEWMKDFQAAMCDSSQVTEKVYARFAKRINTQDSIIKDLTPKLAKERAWYDVQTNYLKSRIKNSEGAVNTQISNFRRTLDKKHNGDTTKYMDAYRKFRDEKLAANKPKIDAFKARIEVFEQEARRKQNIAAILIPLEKAQQLLEKYKKDREEENKKQLELVSVRIKKLDEVGLQVLENIEDIPARKAFVERGRAIIANPCNKPPEQLKKDTTKAP